MPKKKLQASDGEMELLRMLWSQGSLTLADANAVFGRFGRAVSYPTLQTRLNRLVEKGLAKRSEDRPAAYSAAVSEDQIVRRQAKELLRGLGRAKLVPLVAHLISEAPLTAEEVKELQNLLRQAENNAQQGSASKKNAGSKQRAESKPSSRKK